jgi:hypothetical protein
MRMPRCSRSLRGAYCSSMKSDGDGPGRRRGWLFWKMLMCRPENSFCFCFPVSAEEIRRSQDRFRLPPTCREDVVNPLGQLAPYVWSVAQQQLDDGWKSHDHTGIQGTSRKHRHLEHEKGRAKRAANLGCFSVVAFSPPESWSLEFKQSVPRAI